ncbi:hypothetical protein F441_19390, partial [Phytophthora nicotianae CJ01A1]
PSSFSHISHDVAEPVMELRDVGDSPRALLFYFVPKLLWFHVTVETNQYRRQKISERASRMQTRQERSGRPFPPETLQQLCRRLRAEKPYETFEILQTLGHFVALVLCPHKRTFPATGR